MQGAEGRCASRVQSGKEKRTWKLDEEGIESDRRGEVAEREE